MSSWISVLWGCWDWKGASWPCLPTSLFPLVTCLTAHSSLFVSPIIFGASTFQCVLRYSAFHGVSGFYTSSLDWLNIQYRKVPSLRKIFWVFRKYKKIKQIFPISLCLSLSLSCTHKFKNNNKNKKPENTLYLFSMKQFPKNSVDLYLQNLGCYYVSQGIIYTAKRKP